MTLFTMCINVIIQPKNIEMIKNQLDTIPVNIKNSLLNVLCKRGQIKNLDIFKQLINSKVLTIDLSECEVNEEMLLHLHVCKNLQKLDFSLRRRQTRVITTESLNILFKNLHFLKILIIPHCKEVNDDVIKTVCQNCKLLKELHIPNSSISNNSLRNIGETLGNLSVINILGTEISDVGIEYLINGRLSESLSEINIDKCPNISSLSTALIAKKCPNIKIFSFGFCENNEDLNLAMNGIRSKAKQIFWNI